MRAGLQDAHRTEISLEEELLTVQSYLSLERLRFEKRLTITIVAPAEIRRALLPCMSLQHLVENALKHGIARLPSGGEVSVGAQRCGDLLEITVCNPTPNGTAAGAMQSGHGLANTRERLRLLYGAQAQLELLPTTHGMTARLVLPFRMPAPMQDTKELADARTAD